MHQNKLCLDHGLEPRWLPAVRGPRAVTRGADGLDLVGQHAAGGAEGLHHTMAVFLVHHIRQRVHRRTHGARMGSVVLLQVKVNAFVEPLKHSNGLIMVPCRCKDHVDASTQL